jgi:hypothetical protein
MLHVARKSLNVARKSLSQLVDYMTSELQERMKNTTRLASIDNAEHIARELEAHAARIRNTVKRKV